MSNDAQLTKAQEARTAALWDQFGRLGGSGQGEILAEILEEANAISRDLDCGREADPHDLARLLGTVEDFDTTVGAAYLGVLVEAEETWDGIENAPADYFAVYLDLRSLKREVEVLREDARSLCYRVSI